MFNLVKYSISFFFILCASYVQILYKTKKLKLKFRSFFLITFNENKLRYLKKANCINQMFLANNHTIKAQ